MLKAVVVGNVWATKKVDGLPNGAFLEVEVEGAPVRVGSGQIYPSQKADMELHDK